MRNVLTVDVEEYFQVEGFAGVVDRRDWGRHESRVRRQTEHVLDLLGAAGRRATFFVLSWVAEREPDLVREIVARGHEVASHGHSHRMLRDLGARAFRRDLRRSKRTLEAIVGSPVRGYRAPSFSITRETPWAHRILAEEGFAYSSSVFPVRHDRYGIAGAPRTPWVVPLDGRRALAELPPLTVRVAGENLPAAGGGYLRVLPGWAVGAAIRRMNADGAPAVVYFHPWELDPDQPRIAGRLVDVWRHWVGIRGMQGKLRRLLDRHDFGPAGELLGFAPQTLGRPLAAAG